MRFREYNCVNPVRYDHCIYDMESDICNQCGKTFDETRTVWYKMLDAYRHVVPHRYRPKELWYKFKCWGWKRYTTVKPRTLDHGWCDKVHLIPHVLFEMLVDFVESELKPNLNDDWRYADETETQYRQIMGLYNWWTKEFDCKKFDALDDTYDKLVLTKCKELIDISPYMWT